MTITVTLEVPPSVYRLAPQTAQVTARRVEDVLAGVLTTAAPTSENLPLEIQTEIEALGELSDEASKVIDCDPNRWRILAAYRAGQKRLKRHRARAETPREFARRVAREDWNDLTAAVEQAAYRAAAPPPDLAQRAQALVARLRGRV